MKLAEALILRADLQKRIQQLRIRLINNCKVQEGDEPYEKPEDLLLELDTTMNELTKLIQRINKANSNIEFDENISLADVLSIRDSMLNKRNILNELIQQSVIKQDRYSTSEVKFYSTIDIKKYQKELDNLSKEYRELDTKIQSKNWTIDLIE
ncbi:DIP1984 family protein [Clostridium massiliodielmoense]|uniref:DIP1984 family protein n=1 Tax=Clostridium massiliodielmoense TaxID=1776385 RepID=UPI0004D69503|nr:DIP1984 family protein [Clostridium massiliodielmoense]KEH97566.1 hypothetical protein Z962_02825 [Clostridium botulinum C/D str. BKT12695]